MTSETTRADQVETTEVSVPAADRPVSATHGTWPTEVIPGLEGALGRILDARIRIGMIPKRRTGEHGECSTYRNFLP